MCPPETTRARTGRPAGRLEEHRGDVPLEVVDPDHRQPARVGDGLGRRAADQQRADQPGAVRHRDAVDGVEPDPGRLERPAHHRHGPRGAGATRAPGPRRRSARGCRPGRPRRSTGSCAASTTAAAVSSHELSIPRTIMATRLSDDLGHRHHAEPGRFPAGHLFLQQAHREWMAVGDDDDLAPRSAQPTTSSHPARSPPPRARDPPGSGGGRRARRRPRLVKGHRLARPVASTTKKRRAASGSSTARIRGRSSVSREPRRFTADRGGDRRQVTGHGCRAPPDAWTAAGRPGRDPPPGTDTAPSAAPPAPPCPRVASRAIAAESGSAGSTATVSGRRISRRMSNTSRRLPRSSTMTATRGAPGGIGAASGSARESTAADRLARQVAGQARPKRSDPNRLASPPRACH